MVALSPTRRSGPVEGVEQQAHDQGAEDGDDHRGDETLDRPEAHLPREPATAGPASSGQEGTDGVHDEVRVGVMGGVPCAGDLDDPAVVQAFVERDGRVAEDRQAR